MEHTHRGNTPTLGVNLGKEALPAKKRLCPACHSNAHAGTVGAGNLETVRFARVPLRRL
jgi:hypothetical protein